MGYSIEEISDLIEIDRLITSLVRGIDGHDIGHLIDVFDEDAHIDFSGKVRYSLNDFIAFVTNLFSSDPLRKSAHCVVNRHVNLEGDTATATTDVLVTNETGQGAGTTALQANGVVYKFEFTRSPNGWRIHWWHTHRTWDTNRIVPDGFLMSPID